MSTKLNSLLLVSTMLVGNHAAVAAVKAKSPHHKILSDRQVERTIMRAANFVGVPSHLMLAICWIESSYRQHLPEVPDGNTPSYGICQVKLETAQFVDQWYKLRIPATIERLRDPYINAFYAAKYVKYQLKRYDGDWKKAVVAYNRGSCDDNVDKSEYYQKVSSAMKKRNLNTNKTNDSTRSLD